MTTSGRPASVTEAANTNRRLDALIAMRDRLARAIDDCDSMRDLPALTRQMADVLVQIERVSPPEEKGDAVDEIAKRRSARRAGSTPGASRSERSS